MSVTRSVDDTQPIPVIRGRHAARKPEGSRRRRALVVVREVAIVTAVAVAAAIGLRFAAGQVAYVADDAMSPSLAPGERVLVSHWGDVAQGDVALVRSPAGWDSPADEAIVRVIGTEGQRVACCDGQGRITVDGASLDEPYATGPTDQVEFDVTVPAGRIFVLVDDRSAARDSRSLLDVDQGTLSVTDVRGRVVAVLWPPRALGN